VKSERRLKSGSWLYLKVEHIRRWNSKILTKFRRVLIDRGGVAQRNEAACLMIITMLYWGTVKRHDSHEFTVCEYQRVGMKKNYYLFKVEHVTLFRILHIKLWKLFFFFFLLLLVMGICLLFSPCVPPFYYIYTVLFFKYIYFERK